MIILLFEGGRTLIASFADDSNNYCHANNYGTTLLAQS